MARLSIAFDSLITEGQVRKDMELAGFTDISGPNACIYEGDVADPDDARATLRRVEAGNHMVGYSVI